MLEHIMKVLFNVNCRLPDMNAACTAAHRVVVEGNHIRLRKTFIFLEGSSEIYGISI